MHPAPTRELRFASVEEYLRKDADAPKVDILKALQKSIAENKAAPKQAAPARGRKHKAA